MSKIKEKIFKALAFARNVFLFWRFVDDLRGKIIYKTKTISIERTWKAKINISTRVGSKKQKSIEQEIIAFWA